MLHLCYTNVTVGKCCRSGSIPNVTHVQHTFKGLNKVYLINKEYGVTCNMYIFR